jgi:NADPH:quinone reductase
VVCFTGMLSNHWIIDKFYPIEYIPRGVRLTSYSGGAADLPPALSRSSSTRSAKTQLWYPSAVVHHIDQASLAVSQGPSHLVNDECSRYEHGQQR